MPTRTPNICIIVKGRGMTIRRNQVVNTGGSTTVSGPYGIRILGPGNVESALPRWPFLFC